MDPSEESIQTKGSRVNGKEWKEEKKAFRVKSFGVKNKKFTDFQRRNEKKQQEDNYKARLKELKQEKEDLKTQRINDLKRRREIKAEKERFEKMAEKMNKRKIERLRRKEKRNKLLKER
ncbi:rRNA-processing protein Cgr1p [[Candida] jaroonii]|uniref:rRNA-processing protein Cgr1p n=1 Tax=[Candida] jaroonii TaxID=467808 RepID=A0ACA9Y4P7_9ASCO|nr:rRNA-processing protein Cgr1p [[Candida] jaroonii]